MLDQILWIILILGAIDLCGRVLTLLYLMRHSEVRCGKYRTWVLLVAFLNFAFVAYWIAGAPRGHAKRNDN